MTRERCLLCPAGKMHWLKAGSVFLFAALLLLLSFLGPAYAIAILGTAFIVSAALVWGRRGGVLGTLYVGGLMARACVQNPHLAGPFATGAAALMVVGPGLAWLLETMRERNRHLLKSLRQLQSILDLLPDVTFAIDERHRVILWNRAAEEMSGAKKEEMLGRGDYAYAVPFYGHRRPLLVDLVLGEGKDWEAAYDRLEKKGQVLYGEGYAPFANRGRGLHFWTAASPLYDERGQVIGAIQSVRDISDRKRMEERLKRLSTRDTLTDLYNRSYFEEEMRRLEGGRTFPVSIVVGDVDGLKIANDTLGHERGDELLRRAARVIRDQFRTSDVVARIGGDEFAVVLPQTGREAAEEAVGRVRRAVEEDNARHPDLPLAVSLGVATAEDSGQSLWQTFKEADDRMYRDKLARGTDPRSAVVGVLKAALAGKDFLAGGHVRRLKETARLLGEAIGLSSAEMGDLCLLAEMHDTGKLGVPDRILFNPCGLTEEEREEIERHCELGYRTALSSPELAPVAELIRQHHEWWNGGGYPRGLRGEEIHIASRILPIVDAYDAMTSDRPYRKAMSQEEALAELRRQAGTQFDPRLVEIFAGLVPNLHPPWHDLHKGEKPDL